MGVRQPDLPVRVLHVITSPFVGGPHRQVLRQAEELPRYQFTVSVVTFLRRDEGHALVAEATARGVDITGLPAGGPLDLSPVAPLCEFIRARRIEVICAHDAKSTLLAGRAARRCGRPLVAWARGWTAETWRVRLYDKIHLRLLRRADAVVAVSQAMRSFLVASGVPEKRITVIRNAFAGAPAVPDGRLRLELGITADIPLLLSVGRLSVEKGHRYLLETARLLAEQGAPFMLALAGDGRERPALEAQARALRGRVHFLGFRTDVPRLLAEADLLVLPSLTEGLPNVVLEAFAAGVPTVATAVGGVPEVVIDGESGRLVPPRDPRALCDAIAACLRDPAGRRAMGEAGRRSLAAYTVEEQLAQVAALLRRVARP